MVISEEQLSFIREKVLSFSQRKGCKILNFKDRSENEILRKLIDADLIKP